MPRDRVLDPKTRDYVKDGAGGRETTDTAQTALYHQVMTARAPEGGTGGWWRDAAAGSRLQTIQRETNREATAERAKDILAEAVKRLEDGGRVSGVTVTAERTAREGLETTVEATDTRTNAPIAVVLPSIGV